MAFQKRKGDVFKILSKGLFICSNSTDDSICKLYSYIEQNFDELYDYFLEINFTLERGDEYFYFSKKELKADLERKIEAALKWIDIVDFFKTFENSFGAGFRFTPADILVRLNVDATLKSKFMKLIKHYTKEKNFNASIEKLVDTLCKEGYAELENEISTSYKILNSFSFLEELMSNINIPDEVQNEIPE
ncbi:MAG: hypothetical protein NUV58_01490 [Candidatus Roizmanbacteria bacterium]|nr:hypothetical protein [Candidatus Roizmanbacteria bacterium]